MKKIISLFWAFNIAFPLLFAQEKGKIVIPDLKDYLTLKCDFHIHTVFSDGSVWPTVRVDEAYREGLDAISITDHIEGRWNLLTIEKLGDNSVKNLSHNISYEIAQPYAKEKTLYLYVSERVGSFDIILINQKNE